ncbi:MAG: anhydro-N-acetylmuramic acid kinase [Acidobacteria bacterium]|nr:anhydro-N-acetylmuramic acid kinase [Acidobacteriota bacterium]
MRVAGLMSGTSLDGIDVAAVDITGSRFRVVQHRTFSYPQGVRERLLAVSNAEAHVAEISRLNFEVAVLYARAVGRCGVPKKTISLIGSHGQTIFHERGSTLQIGDGSVLAERTGIPVVSDFRTRDIAAGGRGAPLVPYLDYRLFRHARRGRVALNIGGIANVTIIPGGAGPDDVVAFDTGPGNMVIDALVAKLTRGAETFDRNGALAQQGQVNQRLISRLLRRPFYREAPPKTAGREQYGREFVEELLQTGIPLPDLIATATAFTAATIAVGIRRFAPARLDDLIVSGGGAHNSSLMGYLKAFLPEMELHTSSDFGIDIDAKEAICFAVLAYETWRRRPSNLPSATGARHPVILGKVSY